MARFSKFVLWAVESLSRILSPLLFLIHINDLPNCLWFCQLKMYADHTHITYASAHIHSVQRIWWFSFLLADQNARTTWASEQSYIKSNRDSFAHVFPRFASATCKYFEFWLVHWNCLRPLWLAGVITLVLILRHSIENCSIQKKNLKK